MARKVFMLLLVLVTTGAMSQNCDLYIPLVEGKGSQYQTFNNRDRLQGIQDLLIKSVVQSGGRTEAVINAKQLDNRERLQHEGEYKIICDGNTLIIDIQSMLDQAMLKSMEGMEVSMSNIENINVPGNMRVGDKLPDAHMDMKVSMGNVSVTEMKLVTRNRVVEARETITTPAGTFDCFKITYESAIDTRTMGINRKSLSKGVEYYAPGVGNVRSEYYDDKGRLQSYTVLSKLY
jgi:hypothetical protein